MADEVTVQRIGVSPNNCALEEPITLEMDFTVPRDLDHALWRLRVCGHIPPSVPAALFSVLTATLLPLLLFLLPSQFIADTAGCRKIVGARWPCRRLG